MSADGGFQIRAFDATTVQEPGKTGALWRIGYGVRPPSLACDFFKLTETAGRGAGESLAQFPVQAGECVLADRGYSTALGIHRVVSAGGQVTARVNTGALVLQTAQGEPLDLLAAAASGHRRILVHPSGGPGSDRGTGAGARDPKNGRSDQDSA